MNLNRRKLLSWFGLGWLASLLPSSLVGCSEATPPTASTPASVPESVAAAPSGTFRMIGTVAQLDKEGTLLSSDKKIAVVRDPKDSTKLLAVNPTCPHKSCTVKWEKANKEFVCPCHDAKFAADGALRQGPADKPLQRYASKIENGEVFVSA
ncbi:Rieske 2Fe-2S domain-containing protein [Pseudanabaena galeata UHCC 0370]|jgi:cytochrome b6-f complex iron-sulfur subunit|uniref:Rieske 2Fe-2S domain-containing protein n=1 Tax=Pseudanabaena galeata UHCC 0370 TaxID=3110310 RepID=A0ABU5TGU4_9CYAN|nr:MULTISPECIES: Rieske 2Fe-2S domain-containing protein [Pseudanabaena]MEA5477503.1 Rieske 2Fe-2S domain-containing protein [Pseudanabaena galeata UHCC 0370]MEA5486555.1 Rieske 2Fe-2S domain-containing protein [Pseudanabaena sp. CCNP1317]WGS71392.1 Rieske 2Fe-2S domain-containing protein [Pseudanabaena galeata CCNP1313]